jgi:predicted metalloprotease with PDZ domain
LRPRNGDARTTPCPRLSAALSLAGPAGAQSEVRTAPQTIPCRRRSPPRRTWPFPGTIDLQIDASDVTRGVFRVVETVPVPPGEDELILQLPEWHPGKHDARGAMNLIADVRFEIDGRPAAWTRDPVETYAFRIPLPPGARQVTARFVYTSPLQTSEGRIVMTQEMLNLQWEAMSLYPAGHYVRQIRFDPTVRFPDGWEVFSALDGLAREGDTVRWAPVDYETLVDSPVFAGKYASAGRSATTSTSTSSPTSPSSSRSRPRISVRSASSSTRRSRSTARGHFDHYDCLLALTDRMGGDRPRAPPLERERLQPQRLHQVGRDGVGPQRRRPRAQPLAGTASTAARPGLWTPDYRQPMQDNLLWVYEGQDQFWGWVLAARSGLQPKDTVLGAIANSAGFYAVQPGRAWRSVEDTTFDPIIDKRRPQPFSRSTATRTTTPKACWCGSRPTRSSARAPAGARASTTFARAFFGMNDGDWGVLTYSFDDVVAALDAVYPYDWARFLDTRFRQPAQPAPLAGIERAGYRWCGRTSPTRTRRPSADSGSLNLQYSLGVSLDKEGKVTATLWGSPAFDAGIVNTAQVVAVNGEAYSADAIKAAITAAKDGGAPIELLVKRGDRYLTVPVDYHGGLRWPWLEPAAAASRARPAARAARPGDGGPDAR